MKFYTCGKKDVIRPLPCFSFPTVTRFAGFAVVVPPCGQRFRFRKIKFLTIPSMSRLAKSKPALYAVRLIISLFSTWDIPAYPPQARRIRNVSEQSYSVFGGAGIPLGFSARTGAPTASTPTVPPCPGARPCRGTWCFIPGTPMWALWAAETKTAISSSSTAPAVPTTWSSLAPADLLPWRDRRIFCIEAIRCGKV